MSYAFISYGSKDRDIVNPIKDILVANGIKTWVAPDDIPAGSNYSEVINDAIKKLHSICYSADKRFPGITLDTKRIGKSGYI